MYKKIISFYIPALLTILAYPCENYFFKLPFENMMYTTVAADLLTDTDGDGILDDGDESGILFDNPCTGGEISNCDDNCPYLYNPEQTDLNNNGIGDVCECEADFEGDGDVDAIDIELFLADFGRNQHNHPCTMEDPCRGDFDRDGDVDAIDATITLEDFGRNKWNNPCPPCFFGLYESAPLPPADPPDPRFIDHGDGTVTDYLTGLMWTKDAQLIPWKYHWNTAVELCDSLIYPDTNGYDDWRLPSLEELQSLIDSNNNNPALPTHHPFYNIAPFVYWTSTPYEHIHEHVCYVFMITGISFYHCKAAYGFVWPVRTTR
jgi:hypothetical protein